MRTFVLLTLLYAVIGSAESYWQQDVHYTIQASLDTKKQTITGREVLEYTNTSPDILNVAYFHLYWNLFVEGSEGQKFSKRQKEYFGEGSGGITLKKFAVRESAGEVTPAYAIDNTLMKVTLPRPLRPGERMQFVVEFEEQIPNLSVRAGYQGRDYNIAQWYPQIATYDRYGWDKSQYLGPAEFHLEYGTFDVSITLPKSFTLGYTGKLLNPEEVYPDTVMAHLREAMAGADSTYRIADYSLADWKGNDSSSVTWKFHADSVRDFAWSANEHYIWDVTTWSPGVGPTGVTINALYFSDQAEFWSKAAAYTRHAIQYFSEHFGLYAYPNVFVVEGVVGGGMEYPGITFIGHYGDVESHSPFGVITHEVAHNWFPMMVGSNETYYAFMDEGFATLMTSLATEDYFGRYNNAYQWTTWYQKLLCFPNDDERQNIQRESFNLEKTGYEEPVATHTYRFQQQGISGLSIYPKTGSILYMLQYVLGDSVFEHSMKEYFRRWKFKHPYPEDFFSTIEEASGQRDLRWFFDEWFTKTLTCDYGIAGLSAERASDGSSYRTRLSVKRYQGAIMPVDVRVTMADGSTSTVWFPIDLWLNAEEERDTVLEFRSQPIRAELNPDGRILDINRLNNTSPWPKVDFRLDNTLFSVTPVDAYLFRWRPTVWYTDQGGWRPGLRLSGSYLNDLYATTLWEGYNTRDNTFNFDWNFSHNTFAVTPLSSVSFRWYRLEGRKGVTASLQKELRKSYTTMPYHMFRFTYSYSKADNTDYLLHPETWDEGSLHRVLFGYTYNNRGSFWYVSALAQLEGSTSLAGWSDFQYSKRTLQLRGWITLPEGGELALRFYNGIGGGTLPAQTKYYLAGSSPLDQMAEPFFRSKGMLPSTVRDHALSPGGGMMRGYYGSWLASADKIDALTAELRFESLLPLLSVRLPFVDFLTRRIKSLIFLDAGRLAGQSEKLWDKRFEMDCGFGFRLASLRSLLSPFGDTDLLPAIGLQTLRVDFPIYVSAPAEDENKLKLRWVLSVSEAL